MGPRAEVKGTEGKKKTTLEMLNYKIISGPMSWGCHSLHFLSMERKLSEAFFSP